MSNKTQGKLAFNVSKSDNKSGVHNTKPTIRSSITQHDLIKNNSLAPVKRNSLATVTKRKRKSTETTNAKNQTITQFFAPSKPTPAAATTAATAATNKTTNNNSNTSNIEASSSSIPPQTSFSSKNIATTALSTPLSNYDDTDEENVICYIRNIHSVKEIWTSIVGEYGGDTLGDCIRVCMIIIIHFIFLCSF